MTEPLFFDTDGISAFLWVNQQNLITQLFAGRIVIPKATYDELSYPTISHLKNKIDQLINNGQAVVQTIEIDTEAFVLFHKFTTNPNPGFKIIGAGEAAAIALAKTMNGILVSNNLRDISQYAELYGLKIITTGEILKMACDQNLITAAIAEVIWSQMLQRRRKLGAVSFAEFCKQMG